MKSFTDFNTTKPKDKTAIVIQNEELEIETFAVFNSIHQLIITEHFLLIRPNRHLEWRYATEREVQINQ
ncbi:MAG: hypothetical protein V4585_01865, partial [Bacteroidota bacterium]